MEIISLLLILTFVALIILQIKKPETEDKKSKKIRTVIKCFGITLLVILSIVIYNYNVRRIADKAKAAKFDAEITALGDINSVTLSKSSYVDAIWSEYVTLTADQKTYVTKLNTLIAADKKIDELQIVADKEATDNLAEVRAAKEAAEAKVAADVGDNDLLFKWSDYSATQSKNNEYTVYITNTGSKYHRDGCRYLRKSKIAISKSDAISEGYTPCSVCNP